jgi:hypothetical protein
MLDKLTPEQISKSVLIAYDSVELVNELRAKAELSEEETATVDRNIQHVKIMLAKDWFVAALTKKQLKELQAL